jgi:VWFA-related protein
MTPRPVGPVVRVGKIGRVGKRGPVSQVAVVLALSLTVVLAAQQAASPPDSPQASPRFESAVRTVALYATVTNAQGRLVPDLTEQDFAVHDDGKRQTLTLFANEIQPITVVMLLDRSGSLKPNFDLEQRAAEAFVRAMLPGDKARIGSFAGRIQIDPEDFTSDRDDLLKILRTELQDEGPTPLWNAVDRGIDKLLLEQGRRVVLVFTDGVDKPMNFSSHNKSLKDVMRRAEEQGVMVYAIGLAGENGMPGVPGGGGGDPRNRGGFPPGGWGIPGGPGGFGGPGGGFFQFGPGWGRPPGTSGRGGPQLEKPDEGLPKIAAATGGGYFEIESPLGLASTFSRVADELHHQYALGFAPQKLDGKMHEIAIRLTRSDLTARARKRYLASKSSGGF